MNNGKVFGIYGASGFGHAVMKSGVEQLKEWGIDKEALVFIDDDAKTGIAHGHRVLDYKEFLNLKEREKFVVITIANSRIRKKMAERCTLDGIKFWSVRSGISEVRHNTSIEDGAVINSFSLISNDTIIGKHFHLNLYSYVGHDCIIGDYVTFGPRVSCNGYTVVEDHAYIGTGVVMRQGSPSKPLVIGRGAVVGMGAVVTRDVPSGATVVGNPARILDR